MKQPLDTERLRRRIANLEDVIPHILDCPAGRHTRLLLERALLRARIELNQRISDEKVR